MGNNNTWKNNPEAARVAGKKGSDGLKKKMLETNPKHWEEAGLKGGLRILNDPKYGIEHFRRIGSMKKNRKTTGGDGQHDSTK
jgi:hypothetical protein